MNLYWALLHLLILIFPSYSVESKSSDYLIANASTSWTNNYTLPSLSFPDGSLVHLIFSSNGPGPKLGFGFYRNENTMFFLLSLFFYDNSAGAPKVIWSCNRNNLVKLNASLEFSHEGGLLLRDVDGIFIWSTNTSGGSVVGLRISKSGNLILSGRHNKVIWQSFDHPTDTLMLGQKLFRGQSIRASQSAVNWSEGVYSLSVTVDGLIASFKSNTNMPYKTFPCDGHNISYAQILKGSFQLFSQPGQACRDFYVGAVLNTRFMTLASDGHLKVTEWDSRRNEVGDLLMETDDDCGYPLVCGKYGLCLPGYCTCPDITEKERYFKAVDNRQPKLGCSRITPITCATPQHHRLLELKDVAYFYQPNGSEGTSLENCKQACLKNCSCEGAFFHNINNSYGNCYLESDILSLIYLDHPISPVSAFIKVQIADNAIPDGAFPISPVNILDILTLVSFLGAFLFAIITVIRLRGQKVSTTHERHLDQLSVMPARFSYKELRDATGNFCTKIGEGGFGSVYGGVLVNGIKIAVKRLDGLGHVKRSFFTEVKTIGSIHHVNLVSLIGLCAENTERLLVYEYMCNGSLDKWLFSGDKNASLSWQTRKNIILDVAKGLTYLHEECAQRILHLDIKPQNILLDDKFNSKVSDFGLSKLIDRDQSKVITTLKGTFGYLAPEWLGSVITEKVDVYSFGIVVLEIICGRKSLDFTQPEDCMHLLSILERKARENHLHDLFDSHCGDMQAHQEDVLEMLKLAVWCAQSDPLNRPSMSKVVKVLEGAVDIDPNLCYVFFTSVSHATTAGLAVPTLVNASVLSGPR